MNIPLALEEPVPLTFANLTVKSLLLGLLIRQPSWPSEFHRSIHRLHKESEE